VCVCVRERERKREFRIPIDLLRMATFENVYLRVHRGQSIDILQHQLQLNVQPTANVQPNANVEPN